MTNKELNKGQLEFILTEMKKSEKEHPKANVVYSFEESRIIIFYPVPTDFFKTKS